MHSIIKENSYKNLLELMQKLRLVFTSCNQKYLSRVYYYLNPFDFIIKGLSLIYLSSVFSEKFYK